MPSQLPPLPLTPPLPQPHPLDTSEYGSQDLTKPWLSYLSK